MVVLNKIYTRAGDAGETRLVTGAKRLKSDRRVEAYGMVDETNACVGLSRQHTMDAHIVIDAMLGRIQNDLFDLGADLAMPETDKVPRREALRIVQSQVDRLESEIDALNADMAELTSFILPGGSPAAAALHLARTVARRTERAMVALAREPGETVGDPALKYINRLSDFLFVAARAVNDRGAKDVLWVPGGNR